MADKIVNGKLVEVLHRDCPDVSLAHTLSWLVYEILADRHYHGVPITDVLCDEVDKALAVLRGYDEQVARPLGLASYADKCEHMIERLRGEVEEGA